MTINLKDVIGSQYRASLAMLREAIVECPDAMWHDAATKNRFWHIAYHVLFYTHLYLQPSESDFVPWEKHREQYQFMGPLPWPPHEEPEIGAPYCKEDILEYLDLCERQLSQTVAALDLEAESGFDWLPFGKLELQFYNIRHLQHHVGELCERLGTQASVDVAWVGAGHGDG